MVGSAMAPCVSMLGASTVQPEEMRGASSEVAVAVGHMHREWVQFTACPSSAPTLVIRIQSRCFGDGTKVTETAQNVDFRRKLQIFADSPFSWKLRHLEGAGNADLRRKPTIFTENPRKPQIGLRHLRCVTFSSALSEFRADFWGGDATKHFSVKKKVFSEKGGSNSVNWGFGKDFYRKSNSVRRSRRFSEPPDSEN